MIAATLTAPESGVVDDNDDEAHLECCRIDVALCGIRLEGEYDDEADPDEVCEVCFNKDRLGLSCGARFCRLRQAWRQWRTS